MPPGGSDLIFDHRHNAADRVFRIAIALAPPSAGCRTGSVILAAKLIAGHDVKGERREPSQDDPDAAVVLDLILWPEMGTINQRAGTR
jgi:hypothetical protein